MKRYFFVALTLLSARVWADTSWELQSSTLTYTASHTLHGSEGTSHHARGKALCGPQGCQFLVAAPVNSFDSGDGNRDTHMVQTVRGVQFPMVKVSGILPTFPQGDTLIATINVELAGEKKSYSQVPFTVKHVGNLLEMNGVVPMTLADFKIEPPSLLGMAIKNNVPVAVSLSWAQKSGK